jgi:DNA-binding PadR family transcriptional regulator
MRITFPTQLVLEALLKQPVHRWYGLELRRETGLKGGTLYPIVARLEQLGWLESRWEEPEKHEGSGRPRRRYYWLTPDGAQRASNALADRRPLLRSLTAEGLV